MGRTEDDLRAALRGALDAVEDASHLDSVAAVTSELGAILRSLRPRRAATASTWFNTWSPLRRWWWNDSVAPSRMPQASKAANVAVTRRRVEAVRARLAAHRRFTR